MRKIISILLALGLILGASVIATPATAQPVTQPACGAAINATASATTWCANTSANWTLIRFKSPATLLPVNDRLSIKFGTGTSLAAVNAGNVTVEKNDSTILVSPPSINKTAATLDFPVPAGVGMINVGDNITIRVNNVVHPAAGTYNLTLGYKFACCPAEDFCTMSYRVLPATASYGLTVDFNDTYPGIAVDFVPPFKACGQNRTDLGYTTWTNGTAWFNPFDLIAVNTIAGCAVPCANATLFVRMVGHNITPPAPPTVTTVRATFNITGTPYTLNSTNNITLANAFALNATGNTSLQMALHFDIPGTYRILFRIYCPGTPGWSGTCPDCIPPGTDVTLAEKTYDFVVHQSKEAFKLTLRDKWNLISLPLVPLGGTPARIAALLSSIPAADRARILSVWNFDRTGCPPALGTWTSWPTAPDMTMVDGRAYWVRVTYPSAGCGNISWWVWGTEKPTPPASPAQYAVCAGWNMVGFTSLTSMTPGAYLWNWAPAPVVTYGWTQGCWDVQGWDLISGPDVLDPGQGYWMAFPSSGAIFVP